MNVLSGIAGPVRRATIANKLGAGFALVLLLGSLVAALRDLPSDPYQ